MPALGRLVAEDPRDAYYPMRQQLSAHPSTRDYRYWFANGIWLDQGNTPQCVGYSWVHWLEDGPIEQPGVGPIVDPTTVYQDAQRVDEWDGEDYEGTSVRAGAKVLKTRGFIRSYHWAESIDDIIEALLEVGPVVVGTNWYADMMETHVTGLLRLGGNIVGGHAYVLNGISRLSGMIRMKNSWGKSWGLNGHAYLAIRDVERLLHEDGEAALAVEVRSQQ
jgi:hypothetical protein